jgi:hypothetical protein
MKKMKWENKISKVIISCMTTMLLTGICLCSCKKQIGTVAADQDLKNAAKAIQGNMLTGSILVTSTDKEVVLSFNNGKKFLLIQKLAKEDIQEMNDIPLAAVIISAYGIIIKDINTNKLFILPNNDPESMKRCEAAKSLLRTHIRSVPIFGTTLINAEGA